MASENQNARLETFCDGVFAIAITLLDPGDQEAGRGTDQLRGRPVAIPAAPAALWVYAFLLSFLIIGVQWATHHLFMKLVDRASDPFIYSNIFMLLPYVVMPFPTALLAEILDNERQVNRGGILFTILLGNIGWLMLTYTGAHTQVPGPKATLRRR